MNVNYQALLISGVRASNSNSIKSIGNKKFSFIEQFYTFNRHIDEVNSRQKQIFAMLSALLFIIVMIMLPLQQTKAQTTVDGVKWHPGHYYTILNH